MGRIAWMLAGGLAVLAVEATSAADDWRMVELFSSGGDCSKGAIGLRLDCLSREVERIRPRLDGRDGRVLPLDE
jgi:hypothetical protein